MKVNIIKRIEIMLAIIALVLIAIILHQSAKDANKINELEATVAKQEQLISTQSEELKNVKSNNVSLQKIIDSNNATIDDMEIDIEELEKENGELERFINKNK